MKVFNCDMHKIMQSGQCFGIQELRYGYAVQSGDRACVVYQDGQDAEISCQSGDEGYWAGFFGGLDGTYYEYLVRRLEADGGYLGAAAAFGSGLRVLRQDLFECLITFIISQRKTVKAIGSCVDGLRRGLGQHMVGVGGLEYWAFPKPGVLAAADLSGYGLGYREAYVRKAAGVFCQPGFVQGLVAAGDCEGAIGILKSLEGVGDKVASCVALYGLGYLGAFPRDVWVNRVLDREFGGGALFPAAKYAGSLGVVQLYLYYYGRCGHEG